MITGERTYHRRKRFCDGLHIGILEVRLGADSDALAADDKGPSSPFLGVGRRRVLGLMLRCGVRGWLRGRLCRHTRLTMGMRRRMIARLIRLQICVRTTPYSRRGRRRSKILHDPRWAARRQGCRRRRSEWVSATNCRSSQRRLG